MITFFSVKTGKQIGSVTLTGGALSADPPVEDFITPRWDGKAAEFMDFYKDWSNGYVRSTEVAELSNPNHDKRGRFATGGGSKGFDVSRATNATEELELISGHISNSITPAEDDALLNYQSTMEQCQFMNAVLREGPDAFPKEMRDWQNVKQAMSAVPLMQAVMDRTPAMTRPIDVMRGITDPPDSWGPVGSLKGKVLKDDGFISVTKDQVMAEVFASKEGVNAGAVMQIAVPAGSKVMPLSGISYRELDVLGVSDTGYTHPVWEELILQPGTQFKVTSDRMGTGLYGKRELVVEAIPPGDVAKLSNPNHDKLGRFATSGGSPAMRFSGDPTDGLPLPPTPGTIAIPEGTVRLFHQTTEEQALKIRAEGIEARQPTEGPWGVWGAAPTFDARGNAKGFYGRADEKATVEYAVPEKDIDRWGGPLQRSVTPGEVLAVHLPWHAKARFIMESESTLKAVLAGEFDSYKESEGGGIRETVQAIRWVKTQFPKKKNLSGRTLDVSEFFNPNHDKRGRFASGGGGRVSIGGSMVKIKGKLSPSAATKARLTSPTPDVYELDSSEAGVFHSAMVDLTKGNRFASSVHVYPQEEYAAMRTFMTDDGKSGFALHGDEVVSVFSAADSKYKGATPSHLAVAVENGGRRLDCFDTVLPRIYAEAGFEPVARVKWDDEYAPDGWDYGLYSKYNGGRPDVVAMVYNPAAVGSQYKRGAGAYAPDYDAMVSVAESRVAEVEGAVHGA